MAGGMLSEDIVITISHEILFCKEDSEEEARSNTVIYV